LPELTLKVNWSPITSPSSSVFPFAVALTNDSAAWFYLLADAAASSANSALALFIY